MTDPHLLRKQVLHTLAATTEALVANLKADKRYADKLKDLPTPTKEEEPRGK